MELVENKFYCSNNKKSASDFEKIKLLGKGGVGHVYLVRLKCTNEYYAMKVLTKDEMIRKNKVKRVLTEREILATADNPFIVNLYHSFQSKTQIFFIMQYCPGGNFYDFIKLQPHSCLKESQTKFYASEVLLALEYLHKEGFVYRDLKPENILIKENGHIVLTDFDLSKQATNAIQEKVIKTKFSGTSMTVIEPELVANSFVGTEEYFAPEIIKGTNHNSSVDWWTYGILVYEMLYGKTPFKGSTPKYTFENILQCKVDFPKHKRGTVSKECKSLIKHLIKFDAKKRLGARSGAADIKDAPFFNGVNWNKLYQQQPPIIPKVKNKLDTRYFQDIHDDLEWDITEPKSVTLSSENDWNSFTPFDYFLTNKSYNKGKAYDKTYEKAYKKEKKKHALLFLSY
jgi:protein-serine/threonine kinase